VLSQVKRHVCVRARWIELGEGGRARRGRLLRSSRASTQARHLVFKCMFLHAGKPSATVTSTQTRQRLYNCEKEVVVFYKLRQGCGGCVWRCLKDRKSPLELVADFNDDELVRTTYFCASSACSQMYSDIFGGSVRLGYKNVLCSDCPSRN
jgi:hypothetical protein